MINQAHLQITEEIMEQAGVNALLICSSARGGWKNWLFAEEQGEPVLPPFGRNSMILCRKNTEPVMRSALTPHPTDPEQYPVFQAALLDGYTAAGRIGLVNGDCLNDAVWACLRERFGNLETVDVTEKLLLRQGIMNTEDMQKMADAAHLYDRLFMTMPLVLQQDKTERDAVNQIRHRMMQLGAEAEDLGLLTQVWLTSGTQQAPREKPEYTWPGRRLQWGDRINVQAATLMPGNVHAALGRCYVLGKASEETKRGWNLAVRIQQTAAAQLKTGNTLADAMQAAEQSADAEGIELAGGMMLFGTGYSWQGLPRNIDGSTEWKLEEGMHIVVRIPVIYKETEPFCCMDVWRVTLSGGSRLSYLPAELMEL